MKDMVAADFFLVPTVFFKVLIVPKVRSKRPASTW
jgi:hypothetical protein